MRADPQPQLAVVVSAAKSAADISAALAAAWARRATDRLSLALKKQLRIRHATGESSLRGRAVRPPRLSPWPVLALLLDCSKAARDALEGTVEGAGAGVRRPAPSASPSHDGLKNGHNDSSDKLFPGHKQDSESEFRPGIATLCSSG